MKTFCNEGGGLQTLAHNGSVDHTARFDYDLAPSTVDGP
jgi:hypothetical protein